MAERNRRINVTLEPDYARKLASLAERTHVQEGTLARSLLSSALDEADPDAARITEILDGIPGAWERAQEGLAQAARGEGTPLDELA
jgi:predicted transcriptional regulator